MEATIVKFKVGGYGLRIPNQFGLQHLSEFVDLDRLRYDLTIKTKDNANFSCRTADLDVIKECLACYNTALDQGTEIEA